jgi:hypothetical protein
LQLKTRSTHIGQSWTFVSENRRSAATKADPTDVAKIRNSLDEALRQLHPSEDIGAENNNLHRWYSVSVAQIQSSSILLELTSGRVSNLIRLLSEVYPEHDWHEWRFSSYQKGLWTNPVVRIKFFRSLGKSLGILHHELEKWFAQIDASIEFLLFTICCFPGMMYRLLLSKIMEELA